MGDTIKVYSSNYDAKKIIMINPLYNNVEEYTDPSTNILYPSDVSRNYVNFTGDISNNDRLTVELSHYNENTLENYIAGAKKNYLDLSLNHDLHSLLLWGQYKLDKYPTVEYERELEIPVITLIGDTEISLFINDNYVEPGYSALDNIDGIITNKVVITGSVNTTLEGIYDISYDVTDTLGNQAITVVRKITVVEMPVANPYFTSVNTITTNDDWPDGTGFEIANSLSYLNNNSTYSGWVAFRDPVSNPNLHGWISNDDTDTHWVSITYPKQVYLQSYKLTNSNSIDIIRKYRYWGVRTANNSWNNNYYAIQWIAFYDESDNLLNDNNYYNYLGNSITGKDFLNTDHPHSWTHVHNGNANTFDVNGTKASVYVDMNEKNDVRKVVHYALNGHSTTSLIVVASDDATNWTVVSEPSTYQISSNGFSYYNIINIITDTISSDYHPRSWKIQGSNNKSESVNRTWTDIGAPQTPDTPWGENHITEVDVSFNAIPYSSYRLICPYVDENHRSIGYIKLYTKMTSPLSPLTPIYSFNGLLTSSTTISAPHLWHGFSAEYDWSVYFKRTCSTQDGWDFVLSTPANRDWQNQPPLGIMAFNNPNIGSGESFYIDWVSGVTSSLSPNGRMFAHFPFSTETPTEYEVLVSYNSKRFNLGQSSAPDWSTDLNVFYNNGSGWTDGPIILIGDNMITNSPINDVLDQDLFVGPPDRSIHNSAGQPLSLNTDKIAVSDVKLWNSTVTIDDL